MEFLRGPCDLQCTVLCKVGACNQCRRLLLQELEVANMLIKLCRNVSKLADRLYLG